MKVCEDKNDIDGVTGTPSKGKEEAKVIRYQGEPELDKDQASGSKVWVLVNTWPL